MKNGFEISASGLGSESFRRDYRLKYAYLTGGMYRAIASEELVIRMGKANMMGYFGTGGLSLEEIEAGIKVIQTQLTNGEAYGMNLLCNLGNPPRELGTVELYLKYNVRFVEASAFMQITPALALYKLKGLKRNKDGGVHCDHRIMAKISHPKVAEAFMSPVPDGLVKALLKAGKITAEQAELAKQVPVASEICVECDSGGHTDMGVATTLFPSIQAKKTEIMNKYQYPTPIHIGLAGGIGTPEAAASAFVLGADFILTGSINQCTVEGGTSDAVKDMLQIMDVHDTDYAPAGDMFEIGAKVQVLKKGVFFPARANKLFSLYTQYNSLEEIPPVLKKQLEERYFQKGFAEIWEESKRFLKSQGQMQEIKKAEANPKHKMALVFRWYFFHTSHLAIDGEKSKKVDFQVHTGSALGSFNQWVKGSPLEDWRNRHVDAIGEKLMLQTAAFLNQRINNLVKP